MGLTAAQRHRIRDERSRRIRDGLKSRTGVERGLELAAGLAARAEARLPNGGPSVCLSPSELAVLRLAADGLSLKESAAARHVAVTTIQGQRKSVNRKLDARTVTHAVAIALRRGLIQ